MVLGSTQSFNTNEYQGFSLGVKAAWCVGMTTLQPSCVPIVGESWEPQPHGALGTYVGLIGIDLPSLIIL